MFHKMYATCSPAGGAARGWGRWCWAEHPQPCTATRGGPDAFHAPCGSGLQHLALGSPWPLLSRDARSFQHAESLLQGSVGRCYLAPTPSFHPSACLRKCFRLGLVWFSNLLSSPFHIS